METLPKDILKIIFCGTETFSLCCDKNFRNCLWVSTHLRHFLLRNIELVIKSVLTKKATVETWMTLPFPLRLMSAELDYELELETHNDIKFSEIAVPQKSKLSPEYLISGGSIAQIAFMKQWTCDVDVFHCNPDFYNR